MSNRSDERIKRAMIKFIWDSSDVPVSFDIYRYLGIAVVIVIFLPIENITFIAIGGFFVVSIIIGIVNIIVNHHKKNKFMTQLSQRPVFNNMLEDFDKGKFCLEGSVVIGKTYLFIWHYPEVIRITDIVSLEEKYTTEEGARGSWKAKSLFLVLWDRREVKLYSLPTDRYPTKEVTKFIDLFEKVKNTDFIQYSEPITFNKKIAEYLFTGKMNKTKNTNMIICAAIVLNLLTLMLGCFQIISLAVFLVVFMTSFVAVFAVGAVSSEDPVSGNFETCYEKYMIQMEKCDAAKAESDFHDGVRSLNDHIIIGDEYVFIKNRGKIIQRKDISGITEETFEEENGKINLVLVLKDKSKVIIIDNIDKRAFLYEIIKIKQELKNKY